MKQWSFWRAVITATAVALLLAARGFGQDSIIRSELNVAVRMRDGVVLRADVFRPNDAEKHPVLVFRTPYGKNGLKADDYVRAGYIVVRQDARGRYASDGQFESFVRPQTHDAADGYDTIEWAARLQGSSGKVGTFGASYNSFLQWRLAALRPPSLVAMSAQTIPARYTDLEGPGSIRPGRRLIWWVTTLSPDMRRRAGRPGTHTTGEGLALWNAGEVHNWLSFLPWSDLPDRTFEDEAAVVRGWLKAPYQDPWKLDAACKEIAVPNLDIVGWFDHCNGDMAMYRSMVRDGKTEVARAGQRLVVGPWSHIARGSRRFGNLDFGSEAAVKLHDLEIQWFDYWLKGKGDNVPGPPVRIFVMGANKWRDEQEWPLSRAEKLEMYLAGDHANTPAGGGRLLKQMPTLAGNDQYSYDPHDPVPTLYWPSLYTMPADQRPLASRRDILCYQSEPLAESIEVTGNPEVDLYASSSAPDTDFFVRLIDVAPDGLTRDVSSGMVRARYRLGLESPEMLKPGQVYRFKIHMSPTSNLFLAGHRLRLDVTSSDFPNYDRNHNTAADQNANAKLVTAEQTIWHGDANASKIVLPRIR